MPWPLCQCPVSSVLLRGWADVTAGLLCTTLWELGASQHTWKGQISVHSHFELGRCCVFVNPSPWLASWTLLSSDCLVMLFLPITGGV